MPAPSPSISTKSPTAPTIRCAASSKPTPATIPSQYSATPIRQAGRTPVNCARGDGDGSEELLNRIKTPFIESAADEGWSGEAYVSVGETLQERREELHLTLDDVADGLRIKSAYLAALERGRLEELPGQTYAIGFVRAYADYLGLDSEEMLSRFKAETAAFDTRPDLAFPVPLAERSLPGGAMLLVALIL